MKPLAEAVDAVAAFGFSARQARFLTVVMRHTGLCLPRQYATFAGTAYGRKVNDLFTHLVDAGWASSWPCVHNRARLYHVHHKTLYRAIGDADSRLRRAVSARAVTGRIERLDALLAVHSIRWLATVQEVERASLARCASASSEVLELIRQAISGRGDDAPVFGIDETGRMVVLYVMADAQTRASAPLIRPAFPLLHRLPRWGIHVALTAAQTDEAPAFVRAVTSAFAPMSERLLTELRWYFGERRREPAEHRDRSSEERFARVRRAFQDARYETLYRDWLDRGDCLFSELASTALQEAYASFRGTVHAHVLPRTYRHLDPLLQPRRLRRWGVEKGDHTPDALSTPSSTDRSVDSTSLGGLEDDADAPRIRRPISGLRIGGARTGPRSRTPKQPSLFAPGGKERV